MIAFTLAKAVMRWHAIDTVEERVRRGVCVLWKRPRQEELQEQFEARGDDMVVDAQEDLGGGARESQTPFNDYGSDDDSDDDQEKDQQDVLDALEPNAVINDAVQSRSEDASAGDDDSSAQNIQRIEPKIEDVDNSLVPQGPNPTSENAMDVDAPQANQDTDEKNQDAVPTKTEDPPEPPRGLKTNSTDPVLGRHVLAGSSQLTKSKSKINQYAQLRDMILYSDIDKLFLEQNDLEPSKHDEYTPPVTDISSLFPDLQPLSMLDVAPSALSGEGNKKKSDRKADRDDPNKRIEEATYFKLAPTSAWMNCRPVLISALNPAENWHDGEWGTFEEDLITFDIDAPTVKGGEDAVSGRLLGVVPFLYHAHCSSSSV